MKRGREQALTSTVRLLFECATDRKTGTRAERDPAYRVTVRHAGTDAAQMEHGVIGEQIAGLTGSGNQQLEIGPFSSQLRSLLTPMRVAAFDIGRFRGSVAAHPLGEVTLLLISASEFTMERGEADRQIPRARAYALLLQRRGRSTVAQAGRTVSVMEGDIVAIDLTVRFRVDVKAGSDLAVYVIPQGVVDLPRYMINDYVAAKVLNREPASRPIHMFLSELVEQTPVGSGLASRYASVVGQLSETLFRLHVDDDHALHTSKIVKFERIVEYLETHLLDPDLTPAAIADAHFISTRYLQEIFQMHGMTVTAWIRHRRLEQCRQALRDPRNEGKAVAAIAAEWGFTDSAYFSRAFRKEFGVSPSSLR